MSKKKREKSSRIWFRLALFLAPRIVTGLYRLTDLTSRKIVLNREHEDEVCKKGPFNCACFHGTMLFPIYHCRQYSGVIMVSRSWDGELIDRCLRRMGFHTARGSSSRGGQEALAEMIEVVKEKNCCSGLAVDAPRGPARRVKMGIVVTGRETGNPVVPLVSWSTRQLQFRSWDRMIVPLPFSTIVLAFGKPLTIPNGLERDDYDRIRQDLEDEMQRISAQAVAEVQALKRGPKLPPSRSQRPCDTDSPLGR